MNAFSAIAVLLCLAAAGCAPAKARIDYSLHKGITWPGPPEKPRIRYLWTVRQVEDAPEGLAPGRLSPYLLSPQGVFASDGMLYIADPEAERVNVINLESDESFFIYRAGGEELKSPVEVAAVQGTVFVADSDLRKVFAFGPGGEFRFALEGEFERPTGLAFSPKSKVLYVADAWGHSIYRYDLNGKRLGSIGRRGTGPGEFNFPTYIAAGPDGSLYVADTGNFRVQVLGPEGGFKGSFGTLGTTFRDFEKIKGIALDWRGYIYVTDSVQDQVKIFNSAGDLLLFFGQRGSFYGEFAQPADIHIDGRNLYVADTLNGRVQVFEILDGE